MKGFRSHHHPPSLDFFLAQHPSNFQKILSRRMDYPVEPGYDGSGYLN
jgi:hypothetical protein